jgi:hypothetical protein
MRKKCWAAALGDCDGKMSGEHIASAALWTSPTVIAVGGPWGGTGREIAVPSLVAKILCEGHNRRLSPVDAAGGHAFAEIARSIKLVAARGQISERRWMPVCFTIDGPQLERWFVKTAINICMVLCDEPNWDLDNAIGAPPISLVKAAFDLEAVSYPMGLYSSTRVGDGIHSSESLYANLLFSDTGSIAAVAFTFRGFRFMLNLSRRVIAGVFASEARDVLWNHDDLQYHLNRINNDIGHSRSHYIDLVWPGSTFNHFTL